MELLKGKQLADDILEKIKKTVSQLKGRSPALGVILVGDHAPSKVYVDKKAQACEAVGVKSIRSNLPDDISEEDLLNEIEKLNNDPNIDGILVQLPLPRHIDPQKVTCAIDPSKDVDGFHPLNVGKVLLGQQDGLYPCTPLGIKVMIDDAGIDLKGKHIVIIGRSNIVGKPMAAILTQPEANDAVTIIHRSSDNFDEMCRKADVLIVAIGMPQRIKGDMIKDDAVIIDVGINKVEDPTKKSGYKLVGDVDFESVKDKCSYITPVPGGVGPMTIAMLLNNTLISYQKRELLIDKNEKHFVF